MRPRPCLLPHSPNMLEVMASLCTVVSMICDVALDERLSIFCSMLQSAAPPTNLGALMNSQRLFPRKVRV